MGGALGLKRCSYSLRVGSLSMRRRWILPLSVPELDKEFREFRVAFEDPEYVYQMILEPFEHTRRPQILVPSSRLRSWETQLLWRTSGSVLRFPLPREERPGRVSSSCTPRARNVYSRVRPTAQDRRQRTQIQRPGRILRIPRSKNKFIILSQRFREQQINDDEPYSSHFQCSAASALSLLTLIPWNFCPKHMFSVKWS